MRVAQVNDIAYVATALRDAMRRLGNEVDLIDPPRFGARIVYPWRLATVPVRFAGLVEAALRVRHGGYDVVHVHFARLGIVGLLAGQPYVLHCHGTDIRAVAPDSLWGRVVAPALRRARLVYFATPDLSRWVRAFRPDAVFLPNPIEVPAASASSSRPQRDVLVAVRLDPVKGVGAIVELIGRVVALRPQTTMTIVDQGAGVEQVSRAAGANAVIISRVEHEDVALLFRAHRLAIGQQLVGALGNYELEAMATGLPVATQFRFPGTYVEEPPVVAGSTDEAATQIVRLLDHEEERRAFAARARAWIGANHAADTVAARVLDDYRRRGAVRADSRAPD